MNLLTPPTTCFTWVPQVAKWFFAWNKFRFQNEHGSVTIWAHKPCGTASHVTQANDETRFWAACIWFKRSQNVCFDSDQPYHAIDRKTKLEKFLFPLVQNCACYFFNPLKWTSNDFGTSERKIGVRFEHNNFTFWDLNIIKFCLMKIFHELEHKKKILWINQNITNWLYKLPLRFYGFKFIKFVFASVTFLFIWRHDWKQQE